MILTVTLNPLLERRLTFKEIELGKNNRALNEFFTAGGKGINVSRQLKCLNTESLAFTFLGGNNGKILRGLLSAENINFTAVGTKSETRTASLIMEEGTERLTTFFGLNSEITQQESDEFKMKLKKMIENCEIVVFSGSSPCALTDDIFPYGIEMANEFDKISIVDTYGSTLKECIKKAPTVVHNNVHEAVTSMDQALNSEKDILDYMQSLYEKGVKQVFLTQGSEPVYASNFDFLYKAETLKVKELDATGSGDAFTAAVAYGLHNAMTFEETLSFAQSLGALNAASWEACRADPERVPEIQKEVKISTLGKKINMLDIKPVE
ncbi:MAG: 1-phosphofructokinase [Ignavibacteria bacterium]|jgi:1-phosphofructokinase family hexose kinase|nr:1-phosphofructokinase [Ignavibacteria bacterium]MCU7511541.1 1-phosphofructokinase [Ignavibacteria bacterium]MCU7521046.1 1-phosphofructokinase [Ignavibacteria bacterium]MCU7524333.1 1-phosphofructokinase [Ignavibacteria bacterium]